MRQKLLLIFSAFVTVGIFSYLLSAVSIERVIELILGVDRVGLAGFIFLSFSMSFFRTWRYFLVLQATGWQVPRLPLFLIVIVRNFFSDLLPARLGTTVYIFLGCTRLGLPLSVASSSFAVAFLFDILALVPLVLLAVGLAAHLVPDPASLVLAVAFVGAATLLGIFLLVKTLNYTVRSEWYTKLPEKMRSFLKSVVQEISLIREKGILMHVFWLSIFTRLCKYSSLYVFLYALLRPLEYSIADLAPAPIFLAICAAEVSASLPISGLGGFGLYEGTWALAFRLLGFPADIADLTAISHHIFTQIWGYGLGLVALLLLLLPGMKHSTKTG